MCACFLASSPTCSWAQAQTQDERGQVLVTGSARAQRVLDAPFAITAIDASALRDAGPMINLSEVLAQVPGLVVNNRNNYAQDLQISSRGFGARAAFGVRGLRLYADGIPATMPDGQGQVAHFDLAGAQRIEVLRGPFSVLYGNSSGGVIAAFSAPVTQAQTELSLDVGSFGLRQERVTVATPLSAGFDFRGSYTDLNVDGFRPQSAAHRTLGNARLGWRGDADTVTVLVSDHNQQAQDPLGLTAAQFAANAHQTTPEATLFDTRKTIRQTQLGVNWKHRFAEDAALRESSFTAYAGSRGVTQWQSITVGAQTNAKSGGGVVDFDRAYSGVEGKLTWRLGDTDVVAGLNVESLEDNRQGYENFVGTTLGVTGKLRRDETNRATTNEAFVQARTPLAADWDLTGGMRGGRVAMRTQDHFPQPFTVANPDDSGSLTFNYLNPVLGLRWSPAPDWAIHASAARGFESPTLGELAYSSTAAGGFNADLKGQTSRQFELGAKWRRADLALDATLFRADTENEIGVLSNTGGRSIYQNVGRTQRYGAELSGLWRASAALRLQASLSVLHAAYADDFQTCLGTPCTPNTKPPVNATTVLAGNRIAGTQRATGWAEAAWRPGVLPGELALEWRAMARTMANDTNTAFASGYALANLRWSASLPLGAVDAIEALVRIDNLFDRAYVGSVIVNDGNSRFYEPGAPRSGLASLRWQHRW